VYQVIPLNLMELVITVVIADVNATAATITTVTKMDC